MNLLLKLRNKSNPKKMMLLIGFLIFILTPFTGEFAKHGGLILSFIGLLILFLGIFPRVGNAAKLKPVQKFMFWFPRILGFLFGILLSLLALTGVGFNFAKGNSISYWEMILAAILCFIPTLVTWVLILVSRKREWVGGIFFVGLSLFFIITGWSKNSFSDYLIISFPFLVIGIFFFLNWQYMAGANK